MTDRVRIIEDCRPGGPATGQFATYLGKFDYETHEPDPTGNPRFLLDDGTEIWGCECWWSSEVGEGTTALAAAQADLQVKKRELLAAIKEANSHEQ